MLVQFANNWIKKKSSDSQIGCPRDIFFQLFPNCTACSPITYTYARKFEHYAFERHLQNNSIMPKIMLEK